MDKRGSVALAVVIGLALQSITGSAAAVPPGYARTQEGAVSAISTATDGPARRASESEAAAFDALNVTLLSNVTVADLGSGANDIWGYTSPSGREYAIVGMHTGTAFVEVTDATNPNIVAVIPDAPSTWSDMKTYGQYAFNVNESGGGMQVIDLSQVDQGIVTLDNAFTNFGIQTAHNIFINTDSGYAYLAGANSPSFGLVAIDVSDPTNPAVAGVWTDRYAHDVYVTNYADCPYAGRSGPCEIAFAFCGGSGLWVVDVTEKANMQTIGTTSYPQIAYCHQGWATEDKTHIIFDDESDELAHHFTTRLHVADVSDLANPQYVGFYSNGNTSSDHNLMTRGNYAFCANYSSGFRAFDISDLDNIQEVGYFDTFQANDNAGFSGAWGVYSDLPSGHILVSDQSGGLFVLDASDAVGCQLDSHCNDGNDCTTDVCDATGTCTYSPVGAGVACEDGNTCTIGGECDGSGICISTEITSIPCVDDSPCVPGWCDTDAGLCNCIPCTAAEKPTASMFSTSVAKNRYLAVEPLSPGELTALQVTILNMPAKFADRIGETLWVGEPLEICENSGQNFPPAQGCGPAPGIEPKSFMSAPLNCIGPTFRDWSLDSPLYLHGEAIVPKGEYEVRAIGLGCYMAGIATYSRGLRMESVQKWGDIVSNCTSCPCGEPNGSVDVITDVVSLVNKFSNNFCAPIKARADIEPENVDFQVSFGDVIQSLAGFTGSPYPFDGPTGCP